MKGFKPCPVSGLRVAGDFQVSSAILLPAFQGLGSFPFKTRKELQSRQAKSETFTLADLRQLPELNPPVLMPQWERWHSPAGLFRIDPGLPPTPSDHHPASAPVPQDRFLSALWQCALHL